MTPIAALVFALGAGLLLRRPRQAAAAIVAPYLAVLAVQTWMLGSGRGSNPASTISDPGYWVVQVVVLGFALGVASLLSAWRTRRLADVERQFLRESRVAVMVAAATIVAGAVTLALALSAAPTTTQPGDGNPPVIGMVGTLALLITLVVLTAVALRARRTTAWRADPRVAAGDMS